MGEIRCYSKGENMKPYINLTGHNINIMLESGEVITFPPSGTVLRLEEKLQEWTEAILHTLEADIRIPLVSKDYNICEEDLLTLNKEAIYIVSTMLLAYLGHSPLSFVSPDTGEGSAVRDEKGRIVAVRRFIILQKRETKMDNKIEFKEFVVKECSTYKDDIETTFDIACRDYSHENNPGTRRRYDYFMGKVTCFNNIMLLLKIDNMITRRTFGKGI